MDKDGEVKYCLKVGTNTFKKFKGEIPGSDKRFNVELYSFPENKSVCIYESIINAMSHATLIKQRRLDYKNQNLKRYNFHLCAFIHTNELIFKGLAENVYPYLSTNNDAFKCYFLQKMFLTVNNAMLNTNFSVVKFIFIHSEFCRCEYIIRTRSSIFSFLNCVTSSTKKVPQF